MDILSLKYAWYKCLALTCCTKQIPTRNVSISNILSEHDVVNMKRTDGMTLLMKSVMLDDVSADTTKMLISYGADVNVIDVNGKSILMHAIMMSDVEKVRHLISAGANVNICCKKRKTMIEYSFECNVESICNKIVELLISVGINVNMQFSSETNALRIVCNQDKTQNHYDMIAMLLNANGDPNIVINALIGNVDDKNNLEVVKLAIEKRLHIDPTNGNALLKYISNCNKKQTDINFIKFLIGKGSNINARDKNGYIVLWHFIKYRNVEIINLLISAGADVNNINNKNVTTLEYAYYCSNGKYDIIKLLINAGSNINGIHSNGSTFLARLFSPNNFSPNKFEIIKFILKRGGLMDLQNGNSNMLLEYAIKFDKIHPDIDFIKLLIKYGAHIDAQDINLRTPLMIALKYCKHDIIELLLDYNPDINKQDKYNNTALIVAARYETPKVINLLIHIGADVNIRTTDKYNALHYAFKNNEEYRIEIAKLLILAGCEVDVITKDILEIYMSYQLKNLMEENMNLKTEVNDLKTHISLQPEGEAYLELLEEWKTKTNIL